MSVGQFHSTKRAWNCRARGNWTRCAITIFKKPSASKFNRIFTSYCAKLTAYPTASLQQNTHHLEEVDHHVTAHTNSFVTALILTGGAYMIAEFCMFIQYLKKPHLLKVSRQQVSTPEMGMQPVHKQLKPVAILLLFQLLHHFCSAIKICNFWLLAELLNSQSLHAHFYHSSMFECHSWQGSRKRKSVSKTLQKWHFLSFYALCRRVRPPFTLSPHT